MAHFIKIPSNPINMIGQDKSEPAETPLLVGDIFRTMFKDQRFQQHLDLGAAYDLRSKLVSAEPGSVVEVRDDEHAVLKMVCARPAPGLFNPALLYSPEGVDFLRSIADAPTKKPEAS